MLQLPNGARVGKITVFPSDWKSNTASCDVNWYVNFRYYVDGKKPKQKIITGDANRYHSINERRAAIKRMLHDLDYYLMRGYSPLEGRVVTASAPGIPPETAFITAMERAIEMMTIADCTRNDIKSTLRFFEATAKKFGIADIRIVDIRRKHIKAILETGAPSAYNFNKRRAYAMMVFKELIEQETIEVNPVRDISKRKIVRKVRELVTPESRKKIAAAFAGDKNYLRFIKIFFHSGSRPVELLRIRREDIDTANWSFKVTVRKGAHPFEYVRPVVDAAVPLWEEILKETAPGEYIFGKGLRPGFNPCTRDWLTKRWFKVVKSGLGLNADLYALKHTKLDDISDLENLEAAGKLAGHTSLATTKIYAINESVRAMNRLRSVGGDF